MISSDFYLLIIRRVLCWFLGCLGMSQAELRWEWDAWKDAPLSLRLPTHIPTHPSMERRLTLVLTCQHTLCSLASLTCACDYVCSCGLWVGRVTTVCSDLWYVTLSCLAAPWPAVPFPTIQTKTRGCHALKKMAPFFLAWQQTYYTTEYTPNRHLLYPLIVGRSVSQFHHAIRRPW
jgi:hypothetical protein